MIDWRAQSSDILLNPRMPSNEASRLAQLVESSPDLSAHVWLSTSGSSGRIKMVALAKKALLASATTSNAHMQVTADDRWGLVLPRFHVGGLSIFARAYLSRTPVFEQEAWNPQAFCAWCESESITLSSLVSAQLTDLVRLGLKAPSRLRIVLLGGGGVSKDLYARARALGWPILPTYGMTECGSQVATAPVESLTSQDYPELKLLSHLEARVESDGRLAFCGPSLLTGYAYEQGGIVYFEDPKREGWFVSEDCGELKQSGGERCLVLLKGRGSDFIKIGGESVGLPRLDEIWERIWNAKYPSGKKWDAALIPVSDERLGHTIHLAYSGADETFVKGVVSEFNAAVLPFERIRATHCLSELPRSSLGKILRPEILKRLPLMHEKSASL